MKKRAAPKFYREGNKFTIFEYFLLQKLSVSEFFVLGTNEGENTTPLIYPYLLILVKIIK